MHTDLGGVSMTNTVAYVGNFEPEYSTENDVRKAFEHLGWEVVPLQENRVSAQGVRTVAMDSDLLLWTGTWDDAQPLWETIETFAMLTKKGVPTATYHLDVFWGPDRGGRKWWMHPMFFTGTVFTADGDHQREWEMSGTRHEWLRPGVRYDACHPGTFNPEYECDVALVGSNGRGYHEDVWPYRRQLVDALHDMCERREWTFRNPGGSPHLHDNGKIPRGEPMNDFYASAKVTIGDSLCPLREKSRYWSDRAYEAPGRHGFLIMPTINALALDYEGELPMYPWEDYDALEELIEWWLENDGARDVHRALSAELVKKNHTYVNRVETILERVM
jgi:hypothetical protein